MHKLLVSIFLRNISIFAIALDPCLPKTLFASTAHTSSEVHLKIESAPSMEETAKRAYLELYSWRKFKTLLWVIPEKLSDEEVNRLRNILAKRELELTEARRVAASAGIPLNVYLTERAAATRQDIINNINTDVADAFDNYLRTLPYRKTVWDINQLLIYEGHSMTIEQMEKLIHLFSDVDPRSTVAQPTPQAMKEHIVRKKQRSEEILRRALSFLSPPQFEELSRHLELQLLYMQWQYSRIPSTEVN